MGWCVFDVIVRHELSKFSTSKMRSVVCDHFIWNFLSGDLTLHVWDDVLGCQTVQLWYFWPLWEVVNHDQVVMVVELHKISSDLRLVPVWNLHQDQWFFFVCSGVFCTHPAGCNSLFYLWWHSGSNKTCLALLLHFTIPSWVSLISSSISDWSVLGTLRLTLLNSKPSRQVRSSL